MRYSRWLLVLVLLLPGTLFASEEVVSVETDIAWGMLLMKLFGGLALFLYGMDQMANGLKSAAGSKLKVVIQKFTSNRFKSAFTGAFMTAILQSSSITTVLVVGFVSAGIMTLSESVGIIMGANIGTTVTAQIVAFKVDRFSLIFVAVGFLFLFLCKREGLKQFGNIIMGLGLLFFGMGIMSDGMHPLRGYGPFIELMGDMDIPLLGILVGAAFTALVQSSLATMGIVIALSTQGLLGLDGGIAIIFGANIGTCITALLASMGKTREAVRVAVVHVLFNVIGVLAWLAFIPCLVEWVQLISPVAEGLTGSEKMAAEVPRQVANAHALFNISSTLALLPLTGVLAWIATKLVPDREVIPLIEPQYLNKDSLALPSAALLNVRLETVRLGKLVLGMLQQVPQAFEKPNKDFLNEITDSDDLPDALQGEIVEFLGNLRKRNLSEQESKEFHQLMIAADIFERIGDIISDNIIEICQKKLDLDLQTSETMQVMLGNFHELLEDCMGFANEVVLGENPKAVMAIISQKQRVKLQVEHVLRHQEKRFGETDTSRLQVFRMEMDLMEKQRRIYSLIKRLAHAFE